MERLEKERSRHKQSMLKDLVQEWNRTNPEKTVSVIQIVVNLKRIDNTRRSRNKSEQKKAVHREP